MTVKIATRVYLPVIDFAYAQRFIGLDFSILLIYISNLQNSLGPHRTHGPQRASLGLPGF